MIRPLLSMSNLYLNNYNPLNSLKIYPNPSSSYINIETQMTNNLISLVDLSGKVIFVKSTNSTIIRLDIEEFNSGIYILKIVNSLGVFNKKLIFY